MSAPRKIHDKLDSHARGCSGVVSDLPSRPSSTPMDPPAWPSTRICEALIPFTPQITVRVVGFYGFPESSRRPVSHVELNIFSKYIAQSTLPCILMGDFNGDINELPFWQTLQNMGMDRQQTCNITWMGVQLSLPERLPHGWTTF